MNFNKLGNTNVKVSTICLGTMTWGEQNNQKDAFEQMNYALDQGVNFFDTAEIYPSPCFKETYGATEKIIGNWIKEKKKTEKKRKCGFIFASTNCLQRRCRGFKKEPKKRPKRELTFCAHQLPTASLPRAQKRTEEKTKTLTNFLHAPFSPSIAAAGPNDKK